ncbi:hypothetical protein [Streptomyces sp. CHB9.2]|uniref:hypothetical protein n=1 Tax=Streptomyces sp. CHB9.2 TaxID=2841670 RepID=UPI0020958FF8|nr:hypothetical protein [Streptomyces sp. CHB9.2]MCO6704862.1 hypothetical protein [Streptomyces sp. CHB9.2]
MKNSQIPFNVSILNLTPEKLKLLRPVKSPDVHDGVTGNFNEDGLFSVLTFGRVGDEMRDTRFSYIDIHLNIFHPTIYRALAQLRGLYRDIMAGTAYAIFDDKEGDFILANELTGETGYAFFLKHWKKIKYRESKSPVRTERIKMIQKYQAIATTKNILVMPAGLRDYIVDSTGRGTQDEINDVYRRILGASKVIVSADGTETSPLYDNSRKALQQGFNDVYDHVLRMITGKKGFIQEKFGSRRVFNGTRNVISAMDTSTADLDEVNSPDYTDTILGMFQVAKGALPLTIYLLRNGWLGQVFSVGDSSTSARLIDPKTLKSELVDLPPDVRDRWITVEGLEKVIESMRIVENRHKPVMLEDRYLGLVYRGPDMTFKIFGDISELPEGFDRKNVAPLTLIELIYLSGYKRWNTLKTIVTRYPVTGIGSTYPSTIYTKTTMKGEVRTELGDDWNPMEDSVALEFPSYEPLAYVDSQVIHPSRLGGLGADFDGDTASSTIVYTQESIDEIDKLLNSREAYLDPRGGFKASCNVQTVQLVLRNMTGD